MKKAIFSLIILMALPGQAWAAITPDDRQSVLNDTVFYDTSDIGGCATGQVSATTKLSGPQADAINALKDIYTHVAQEKGIAWQVLAAIDFRESGNDPNKSALAGEPIGSPNPDHPDIVTKSKLDSVQKSADFIKSLAKGVYGVDVKASNSFVELQETFLAYNRGALYKQAGQSPDVSPYVMNFYDDSHQNMKWVSPGDPSSIAGKEDTNLGAMTVYRELSGSVACGGASGNAIVDVARAELAKNVHESPDGCNCGGQIDLYTDHSAEFWCADFVSWVYKQAGVPFSGGDSGGWRIASVATMKDWFRTHGLYFDRSSSAPPPQPGDAIFFFRKTSGDSNDGNHVGIVDHTDGDTVYTIEGNHGNAVATGSYKWASDSYVVGWGRLK